MSHASSPNRKSVYQPRLLTFLKSLHIQLRFNCRESNLDCEYNWKQTMKLQYRWSLECRAEVGDYATLPPVSVMLLHGLQCISWWFRNAQIMVSNWFIFSLIILISIFELFTADFFPNQNRNKHFFNDVSQNYFRLLHMDEMNHYQKISISFKLLWRKYKVIITNTNT